MLHAMAGFSVQYTIYNMASFDIPYDSHDIQFEQIVEQQSSLIDAIAEITGRDYRKTSSSGSLPFKKRSKEEHRSSLAHLQILLYVFQDDGPAAVEETSTLGPITVTLAATKLAQLCARQIEAIGIEEIDPITVREAETLFLYYPELDALQQITEIDPYDAIELTVELFEQYNLEQRQRTTLALAELVMDMWRLRTIRNGLPENSIESDLTILISVLEAGNPLNMDLDDDF